MRILITAAAAALALSPVAAIAQTDTAAPLDATSAAQVPEEDDEFPWGLLGLLGLAGLLGRKRDDRHTDNRRTA